MYLYFNKQIMMWTLTKFAAIMECPVGHAQKPLHPFEDLAYITAYRPFI